MHFNTSTPQLNRVMPANMPHVTPAAPMVKPPIPTAANLGCVGCSKSTMHGVSFGTDPTLTAAVPWYSTTAFKIFLGLTLIGGLGLTIFLIKRR